LPILQAEYFHQTGLNIVTIVPIAETNPKGALLSRLVEYNNFPDDWDGYGGKAASTNASHKDTKPQKGLREERLK